MFAEATFVLLDFSIRRPLDSNDPGARDDVCFHLIKARIFLEKVIFFEKDFRSR
jgi:hypothetical protein